MARHQSPEITYSSMSKPRPWKPGALRRIPWAGLLGVVGAIIGIIASIAILVVSDGSPIPDWSYPPTVYLSIAYTITNILLAASFAKSVTITWWNKALSSGTQLGDLHRYWDQGNSPLAAVAAGKHFNFIAFAALFLAITPVNGPLLQRSSSVGVSSRYSPAHGLSIQAASSIEFGTGYISGRSYAVPIFSNEFNAVVQAYNTGQGIPANHSGCSGTGTCSGRLTAAGLAVNCSSYPVPLDLSQETVLPNGTTEINWNAVNGTDVFMSEFAWDSGMAGNISLNVQYKGTPECGGEMMVQNCSIRAATVQYPIIIDGNRSTIALEPGSTIFDDILQSIPEYDFEQSYGQQSPIGGYALALSTQFDATSHLRWVGAAGYELISQGPTGPQFANQSAITDYSMGMCNISFNDPVPYLLEQARELMFRTAIAGGNSSYIQAVQGASQVETVGIYKSHYLFLGVAVAVTAVAICIVLATYNGYWHLGREVTMSPLEIARAFNAPLLAQQHSNAEVKELVKGAGDRPVRYGTILDIDEGKRGEHVQVFAVEQEQMRLEIADSDIVQPLRR